MKILMAILLGGLVAGALDILYACIVYGPVFPMIAPGATALSPIEVFQSVDRGWIGGPAASAGGTSTAIMGLATHFGIATIMAAVYVFAAKALPMLTRQPIIWGFVYGLMLMFVMNYVVLPISAAHTSHQFASGFGDAMSRVQTTLAAFKIKSPVLIAGTVFTHTVLVGIPIALIAARFAKSDATD